MGQTVHQIKDHIESSRNDLRANLEELSERARTAVNWRAQFRRNPGGLLAVAFGGGFILANMIGGSSRRRIEPDSSPRAALTGAVGNPKGHVLRAWDDIQSALVRAVAMRVIDTLAGVIPRFKDQIAAGKDDTPRCRNRSGRVIPE